MEGRGQEEGVGDRKEERKFEREKKWAQWKEDWES